MLSDKSLAAIRTETANFWCNEVNDPTFIEIAGGKEPGHKIADRVDEKTTTHLMTPAVSGRLGIRTAQEHSGNKVRSRSMGDLWVADIGGVFSPMNIKAGIVGSEGQPNMVSLKKVLSAMLNRQIDSYYLNMVKIDIKSRPIRSKVILVDMFDYFDYLTFDSGPGQIMLKADAFSKAIDEGACPKKLQFQDRIRALMALYEDGERRLRINRDRDLAKFRSQVELFFAAKDHAVSIETQRGLTIK